MTDHPLDGEVVLKAGALASVPLKQVETLLCTAQEHIEQNRGAYRQQFERIEGEKREYYLAQASVWDEIEAAAAFTAREVDAVERAHELQFERDGRRLDRAEEFAAALEIRSPVAVDAE